LFDEFQELPDLKRLRFTLYILQVQEFGDGRVLLQVMAPRNPHQSETERLGQCRQFSEPDVL
jgi:hypothetical protein